MEVWETVAQAGTSHKAVTVMADEWELTPVAMFVTSSYGHILPKELANSACSLPPKYLHLFSVLIVYFCTSVPMAEKMHGNVC